MHFIYALINFALLAVLVYLIGGKLIAGIFAGRRLKINSRLDEMEVPLPEEEPQKEKEAVADLKAITMAEAENNAILSWRL
jgi:hypothetical protein